MRLHGDFPHRLAIYVLKDILTYKGVKFRDERQFKKLYHSPCEPDIFFEFTQTYRKGNKKQKIKELHVIEVETNPTAASVNKKQQQYEEALAGVQLTVIDIGKILTLTGWEKDNGDMVVDQCDALAFEFHTVLDMFRTHLEQRLPI